MRGTSAEVLVIGGGVIGAAAAHALAARGRDVVLLDKGDVCSAASAGNAGLVVPSHAIPLAAPGALGQGLRWLLRSDSPFYIAPRLSPELAGWLWRFRRACRPEAVERAIPALVALGRASQVLFRELAGKFDFGYEERGWLLAFGSRAGFEAGRAEARLLARFDVESELLEGAAVRQRVAEARASILGGVFYPEDAQVIPDRLVHGLARLAEAAGARMRPFTEVRAVHSDGARIHSVDTSSGCIQPKEVVLAAGAWSPAVARQLGLRLPIEAAKGYSLTLKVPSSPAGVPLYLAERKVAVTRWRGMLRLSGTLELAGLDLTINPRRVAAITSTAAEYLEGFPDFGGAQPWAGLRPVTPDGLPIIGRSRRLENLIVASGHGMLGITFGPITGELVAQVACGEAPALDLAPFRVDRFG